jgi:hypothetical protein
MPRPRSRSKSSAQLEHCRFWPETVITVQRIAVGQVDYGRKLRIGGMSCPWPKFLQRFSWPVRYCSAHLQWPPRSLLYPQLPSRWRRRVTWSKCVSAGGTGAGAIGMVDAIGVIPSVVGAASMRHVRPLPIAATSVARRSSPATRSWKRLLSGKSGHYAGKLPFGWGCFDPTRTSSAGVTACRLGGQANGRTCIAVRSIAFIFTKMRLAVCA